MAKISSKQRRQVQAARKRLRQERASWSRYLGQVCTYMWMDERVGQRWSK